MRGVKALRRWFEKFRSDDFSFENELLGRRPEIQVENNETKDALKADISQTMPELAAKSEVAI